MLFQKLTLILLTGIFSRKYKKRHSYIISQKGVSQKHLQEFYFFKILAKNFLQNLFLHTTANSQKLKPKCER